MLNLAYRCDSLAKGAAKRATAVPTDVADPDSVATLFDEIKSEHGRLDVLFNNAGLNTPGVLFPSIVPNRPLRS